MPANITDIKERYTVTRGVANANPYYHEDRFYNAPTLLSRMTTLYHQSLSARRVRDTEYDTNYSLIEDENDSENRDVELLKVFSMVCRDIHFRKSLYVYSLTHSLQMCLLTPVEVYDPFYAHYAISLYPRHVKTLAIDDLRARGALIRAKGERSVPDSKYGMAARLGSLMVGKLPENMFTQAKEYYKYLCEQTTSNRFLPEFVSSGMMACLLSLVSENKVSHRLNYALNFMLKKKNSWISKLPTKPVKWEPLSTLIFTPDLQVRLNTYFLVFRIQD